MKERERFKVPVVGGKRDGPLERRNMLKMSALGAVGTLGVLAGYAWAKQASGKTGAGTPRFAI